MSRRSFVPLGTGDLVTRSEAFPAVATSVGDARRFAVQALGGTSAAILDDVVLMVSELATNAVQHAVTSFYLAVQRGPREIRIEVTDLAGGARALGPQHSNGHHGLRIVDLLSTRWGVSAGPESGKTVWFTLAVPDSSPRRIASSPALPRTEDRGLAQPGAGASAA